MGKGVKKGGSPQTDDFLFDIFAVNGPTNLLAFIYAVIAVFFVIFIFRGIENWLCPNPQLKVGDKVKAYITPSATVIKRINGKYVDEKEFYLPKWMDATITATPSYFTTFIVEIDTSSQASLDKSYSVNGCEIKV